MTRLQIDYTKVSYMHAYKIVDNTGKGRPTEYVLEVVIDWALVKSTHLTADSINKYIEASNFKIDKF